MVCNAKGKSKLGELIMEGRLYGVGVGPGNPELITLKAIRVMEECEMIAIPGENPQKSVAYTIAKEACPCISKKEHLMITTPMTKDRVRIKTGKECCIAYVGRSYHLFYVYLYSPNCKAAWI